MSQLLSGKVKVVKPINVSEDRYEYLRLNEAEPNLGVPVSGSLSSGSIALVASDADGNRLFVTTLQLEQVSGSFSGSFAGDGSQLNNLPEAVRLLSGSASASISTATPSGREFALIAALECFPFSPKTALKASEAGLITFG